MYNPYFAAFPRSNGAALLAIPTNYYDDLQVRFYLDNEFTTRFASPPPAL